MTEAEAEQAHDVKEATMKAVEEFVNRRLAHANLTPEQEEAVRQELTEQVRFWKDY